jgi:magnesium chelatase family protein
MIGPPGSGKSMLARRVPTILPEMSFEEALETTKVFSVVGGLRNALVTERPFRSPHHTISEIGLIGGGSGIPRPGEVSLAHHGVLFLDELPEFRRAALEVLRQPLEDGSVTIRRSQCTVEYPANLMMVAAMNPCPCGYAGARQIRRCSCSPDRIRAYRSRISGPLLDRIDLHVEVASVPVASLTEARNEEASREIRERVNCARSVQARRFVGDELFCNAQMSASQVETACKLDKETLDFLALALAQHGMSARAYGRILKVARTIADLAGDVGLKKHHIAEAVGYRVLDRAGQK